jgi:hypothetical protein
MDKPHIKPLKQAFAFKSKFSLTLKEKYNGSMQMKNRWIDITYDPC